MNNEQSHALAGEAISRILAGQDRAEICKSLGITRCSLSLWLWEAKRLNPDIAAHLEKPHLDTPEALEQLELRQKSLELKSLRPAF